MKLAAMLAVSVVAHLAAGWVMARTPRPLPLPPPSPVEMTVVDRPPPPPPPPLEPPPAREPPARAPDVRPRPLRVARPVARPAPDAPPPAASDIPAPAAEPLDLTDGPALPVGGGPDPGPATAAARVAGPARAGPRTVALADLSRPPAPPSLDAALARRYPAEARAAGRTGRAVVRARIDESGRASVLRVVSASEPAFGDACRGTVDGSRWRPPLDESGAPVATEITYTCTFELTH